MTDVHTEQLTDVRPESIRSGLRSLLKLRERRLEAGSGVLLLPDVHYPYHPSTGLVTNPDVVAELADLIDGDVAIGLPSSEFIDGTRAGQYLGYESASARTGADLLDLTAAGRVHRRIRFAGTTIPLQVPEPVLERSVVVVPTARRSAQRGVAAGMVTLALAIAEDPGRLETIAAMRACWPEWTVLDATYTYETAPSRTDLLIASDDLIEVSLRAAEILDVARSDVPHLRTRKSPPSPLRSIASAVPGSGPGAADGLVDDGYRLYARLTGDLVPPQMLPRGEDE